MVHARIIVHMKKLDGMRERPGLLRRGKHEDSRFLNGLCKTASLRNFAVMTSAVCLLLILINSAKADKGSISPGPTRFSEESQIAIIMHNGQEEVLMLGTEFTAEKETGILEFIPFPSEPDVKPAGAAAFTEMTKLLDKKGIELLNSSDMVKGGAAGKAPVEIMLSEKIGLHDLTVIKINNISEFTKWAESFFAQKGIEVTNDLSGFYKNAEDYVSRGFVYFAIDYVTIKTEKYTVEPLIYRFKTDKIYYPLKTSNVVGGAGLVDLIIISPGSFIGDGTEGLLGPGVNFYSPYIKLSESPGVIFEISNSERIDPEELGKVYPEAVKFFSGMKKPYIQVLSYRGPYVFKNDILFDPAKLAPRNYYWHSIGGSYPWETTYYLMPGEDAAPIQKEQIKNRNKPKALSKKDALKILKNMSYHILMGDETVALRNGEYKRLDSIDNYLRVFINNIELGDLDGDGIGDAAVVIVSSGGGSGAFFELTVLLGDGRLYTQQASAMLGDKIKVKSLKMKNGTIIVDILSHKENDPDCCPSLKVAKKFKLAGGSEGAVLKLQ